jgi:hypothetical protein
VLTIAFAIVATAAALSHWRRTTTWRRRRPSPRRASSRSLSVAVVISSAFPSARAPARRQRGGDGAGSGSPSCRLTHGPVRDEGEAALGVGGSSVTIVAWNRCPRSSGVGTGEPSIDQSATLQGISRVEPTGFEPVTSCLQRSPSKRAKWVTVQSSGPWAGIPACCSESCEHGACRGGGGL